MHIIHALIPVSSEPIKFHIPRKQFGWINKTVFGSTVIFCIHGLGKELGQFNKNLVISNKEFAYFTIDQIFG